MSTSKQIIGIDLFSSAGGMSLGARWAGVEVVLAVEKDPHAAMTYKMNHKDTCVLVDDIKNVDSLPETRTSNVASVLFGCIPCQGFSYSNQRSRNKDNKENWSIKEFIN